MLARLLPFASLAALCAGFSFHGHSQTEPPPSSDPFYNVPANISSYSNGQVIKHRDVTTTVARFFGNRINLHVSYDILYRTEDSFGNPTATVTTLLLPHNANLTQVLSYQLPEDAAWINCAPSYSIQGGPSPPSDTDSLAIAMSLLQGWVVVIPDHEGPKAAYLANINAAHAILDSFRAVTSSDSPAPIPGDAIKVMWGYSGGSITSAAAAERLSSYAPELTLAGAALGGTAPNLTNVISTVNDGPFAGLIPAGVLGLAHEYPAQAALVRAHLRPATAAKFRIAEQACLANVTATFAFEDILDYFDDAAALFANPTVLAILHENALGEFSAPTIPLLVYKAIADELSPVADTDALVQRYCAAGAQVQYHRAPATDHVALAFTGLPLAFAWVKDRLDGLSGPGGCATYQNITSFLS